MSEQMYFSSVSMAAERNVAPAQLIATAQSSARGGLGRQTSGLGSRKAFRRSSGPSRMLV